MAQEFSQPDSELPEDAPLSQGTACSLNIVFFPYNFVIFLKSAGSAAALVFYLPGACTHTDNKGKQRKTRDRNILKFLEKKTQYLMNTGYYARQNQMI